MDYSNFSVSVTVILLSILAGVILGVITLILARRKRYLSAIIVGISSLFLIAAWVVINGLMETRGTNLMLSVADDLAVPERLELGREKYFTDERIVRATGAVPCMAVTAPCPSLHRQWSAPEGQEVTREGFEKIIRDSGWQDELAIEEKYCDFIYTNSSAISCTTKGVVGGFDTMVYVTQTRGEPWHLHLDMEPARR